MKLWAGAVLVFALVLFSASLDKAFPTPDVFFESINFSRQGELVFDDAYRGSNPSSEIVFAYFMDFRCPSCLEQHPTIEQLQQNYPQINFLYKHLAVVDPVNSPFAATVYECGKQQGVHQELSYYMFAPQFTQADVLEYVESLGVDMNVFLQCIHSEETALLIKADKIHASLLDVRGTPTVFINGIKVEGAHSFEVYEALIEGELDE